MGESFLLGQGEQIIMWKEKKEVIMMETMKERLCLLEQKPCVPLGNTSGSMTSAWSVLYVGSALAMVLAVCLPAGQTGTLACSVAVAVGIVGALSVELAGCVLGKEGMR